MGFLACINDRPSELLPKAEKQRRALLVFGFCDAISITVRETLLAIGWPIRCKVLCQRFARSLRPSFLSAVDSCSMGLLL